MVTSGHSTLCSATQRLPDSPHWLSRIGPDHHQLGLMVRYKSVVSDNCRPSEPGRTSPGRRPAGCGSASRRLRSGAAPWSAAGRRSAAGGEAEEGRARSEPEPAAAGTQQRVGGSVPCSVGRWPPGGWGTCGETLCSLENAAGSAEGWAQSGSGSPERPGCCTASESGGEGSIRDWF